MIGEQLGATLPLGQGQNEHLADVLQVVERAGKHAPDRVNGESSTALSARDDP